MRARHAKAIPSQQNKEACFFPDGFGSRINPPSLRRKHDEKVLRVHLAQRAAMFRCRPTVGHGAVHRVGNGKRTWFLTRRVLVRGIKRLK